MRFFLIPAITMLIVGGVIDFYIYCVIRNSKAKPFWSKLYAVTAVIFTLLFVWVIVAPKRNGSGDFFMAVVWSIYTYASVYIPKIVYAVFRFVSAIPRLFGHKRMRWLSMTGGGLALAIFVVMWWGALINRYNIQRNDVTVEVAGLPAGFNGLTIAQISDLHLGTFGSDTTFVSTLVDSVNALHPDVIVFTGDIVSRRSDEMAPFVSVLSRLRAPKGVYSIMGNHDYGDYHDWSSEADKEADVEALKNMQAKAGLMMLNNDTEWLKIGPDSIALIGVENIGDPPFKSYGDLEKAYPNLSDSNIKVLLTHNPAHWESAVENNPKSNVALTLAGHTHAMQFEVMGMSPAAFRYDKWGGMFVDSLDHHLYVNIGAGTVGLPYRIGATPEITLLTLKPKLNR